MYDEHRHAGLGLGVQGALSGAPVPQHIPDDKHGDHGQRRKQRLYVHLVRIYK